MIELSVVENCYCLLDSSHCLRNKHISHLEYLGFAFQGDRQWIFSGEDSVVLREIVKYFNNQDIDLQVDNALTTKLTEIAQAESKLSEAIEWGTKLKQGDLPKSKVEGFLNFIENELTRQLKQHQIKAALHLLFVENAANFSVPGAGKTTVILSVFAWLKKLKVIDSLFVIGPPSCFRPWRDEFTDTIGRPPKFEIMAGGNIEQRRLKYYNPDAQLVDLYLTTFQTLQRDVDDARYLLTRNTTSFFPSSG